MRARVGEDQGTIEPVNRAVYATCAALIWHQGLGAEALALAEGKVTTPSKVRICPGQFEELTFVVTSALLSYTDYCKGILSVVCVPGSCMVLS